ncbi:NADH:flavin oxidoreductase/NADH oxidase [Lenzites betulinus]|nr:NADH:flavin oxidoreductase/NADH oxidase [Lenzites betulinus]
MSSDTPALFKPTVVGQLKLAHRVVMAPLTRLRADDNHVPTKLGVKYYEQRASVAGTLLITEGTLISPQAGGIMHVPGIWSAAQIAAWKRITDAVHAKGSSIYLQLWAMGRTARPPMLHRESPDYPHVAPSPIPLSSSPDSIPRELTKDEIKEYVQWYATAAANAVHEAGFDGVEITAANGYLIDQFLQDVSNQRTDEYGGPVGNRARFALEVVEAVVEAVSQTKTAIRLSPWSVWQDMREENPVPTFSYLAEELKQRFPNLAYLHVVAPSSPNSKGPEHESDTHFIHKIWAPRAMITTGGYDRESGLQVAEETGQLVGYGTAFLANPDLPFRLQHNIELNEPDQQTVYLPMSEKGYTTYPFSEEFLTLASELEAHYLPKPSPRLGYP